MTAEKQEQRPEEVRVQLHEQLGDPQVQRAEQEFGIGQHPWHRFVALGDSYTEGVGDPEPRSLGGLRGWADRVAEELSGSQPDFAYANLAVRGMLLQQILDRQLDSALALRPDLVAMSGGGNDIIFRRGDPDKLADKMDQAVQVLAGTGAAVLLFAGPDWGNTPVFSKIRGRAAVYNEHLHAIGARRHAIMVDLWCLPELQHALMWDPDRLHLSPLGHHSVAVATLNALGVDHPLQPLQPRPLPAHGWKHARAEDLVWARQYFVPWVLKRLRPHPVNEEALVAKRPQPSPVFGLGRPGPFPSGHPAARLQGREQFPSAHAEKPGQTARSTRRLDNPGKVA
ncbi:SGNH/GDSL hydrolase family protein [Pseudarthrobacter sp. NamB4]|uniref:SGNH/GDSL hydrolase family protein n=1 Tax=Pseudarthrobacter sp. NamB4 TaxID=2576837 RepID=UPI0010FF5BC2|nr:SGNH/GDSL hydrolase family protein [Pseudarthrobacter sp. NamB4]TLM75415.1 SGNH/GDSL hydrolase family protein [Pseudarthrobacter sp. NamB4]